jgi:hypothetical protein
VDVTEVLEHCSRNTWLKFPQVLLAKLTNKQSYKDKVSGYCTYISTSQQKTPKGLVYIDQWGSLRMAANAAFICASVITNYYFKRSSSNILIQRLRTRHLPSALYQQVLI